MEVNFDQTIREVVSFDRIERDYQFYNNLSKAAPLSWTRAQVVVVVVVAAKSALLSHALAGINNNRTRCAFTVHTDNTQPEKTSTASL